MTNKSGDASWKVFARICLISFSIIIIFPFIPVIINSFKSNQEFYADIWALPDMLSFSNYEEAFLRSTMSQAMFNSAIVSCFAVVLTLALGSMVSYVISRRKIRYGRVLINYYLVGLLIPQVVSIIPLFLMARILHLYDTLAILIFTYTAFEIPFCVFTMAAFFKTLPKELEESAMIDGASNTSTFIRIILPLAKHGLITVAVFAFLDFWSEYARALVFISSNVRKTISIVIMAFKPVSGYKVEWGILYAACVIFILPVIVVYCIFQRQLIEGLTTGGVKG